MGIFLEENVFLRAKMNVKFQIYLLYRNHKTFYKKEKNNVDKDLHFFTVKHSYALYIAK